LYGFWYEENGNWLLRIVSRAMDEVQAKRETVVITKHGKPVAKPVPVEPQGDDIHPSKSVQSLEPIGARPRHSHN
jgi:prevent-host-death family protein